METTSGPEAAPSDLELLAAVRAGDPEAFGVLWQRHYHAARAAALRITRQHDPDDLAQEAFARTLAAIRAGKGPTDAFRPYLYATVRSVSITWAGGPPAHELLDNVPPQAATTEDFADSSLERSITATAFRALPDDWRAVLWYTEVEGIGTTEAATFLGLTPAAAAALAYRAREGLRRSWLQAHVAGGQHPPECDWVVERLAAYQRGGLTTRQRHRVDEHVAGCLRCAILVEEVDELARPLRAVLLPIVLGAGAIALPTAGLSAAPAPPVPGDLLAAAGAHPTGGTGGSAGGSASGSAGGSGGPGDGAGASGPGRSTSTSAATAGAVAGASTALLAGALAVAAVVLGVVVLAVVGRGGDTTTLVEPPLPAATAAPSAPVHAPTSAPPDEPPEPTTDPRPRPSDAPTARPTASPTPGPSASPTPAPSASPTPAPTASPTPAPSASPTPDPSPEPTPQPTSEPPPEPTPHTPAPEVTSAPDGSTALVWLPTLAGTGVPGAEVEITCTGGAGPTVATVARSGRWQAAVDQACDEPATYSVVQRLDGRPASAPVTLGPFVFARPWLEGLGDAAVVVDSGTLELVVAGDRPHVVTVEVDGAPVGQVDLAGPATATSASAPMTVEGLGLGRRTVTLAYTDPATGRRGATATSVVTIAAPAAPVLTGADAAGTSRYLPRLEGTALPGAAVTVQDQDGRPAGSATADPTGAWRLTVEDSGRWEGAVYTARQRVGTGAASRPSAATGAYTYLVPTIDDPAPGATVTQAPSIEVRFSGDAGQQVRALLDGVARSAHTLEAAPIVRTLPDLSLGRHTVGLRYVEVVDGTDARWGVVVTRAFEVVAPQ